MLRELFRGILTSSFAVLVAAGCRQGNSELNSKVSETTYRADVETYFKKRLDTASKLADTEKCKIPKGTILKFASAPVPQQQGHVKVTFKEAPNGLAQPCGFTSGFLFAKDLGVNLVKVLNVPYLCQYRNAYEKESTCNNTSLAMTLKYQGENITPDEIYNTKKPGTEEIIGASTGFFLIQDAANALGYDGVKYSSQTGTADDIKKHIDAGRPVILGGYFTGGNGHYVLVVGYDDVKKEWIVNDPAGKWDGVAKGTYANTSCEKGHSGQKVRYSYKSVLDAMNNDEKGYWIIVPIKKSK